MHYGAQRAGGRPAAAGFDCQREQPDAHRPVQPQRGRSASATLQVATTDPVNPSISVALTGSGLVPAIQTSSASLVYGPTVFLSRASGYGDATSCDPTAQM